ncbi:Isoleucine--tRNA ligase, cytoplasmic [Hypsibius exemplaris]|uniref:Isoleucine--tRNA ligase, cytoplasmic n=1 Tax=Hypsibius exemplaris TaxID=2072580 RepID=A0A1W0XAP5_HYPEX|nr:Isoleucine--tRNA ligase, cytoplasmic [Hypsibius exemplaris]
MVLHAVGASTALFNKPPSKNVIVNGLVLADDGQKMSKSKKELPGPNGSRGQVRCRCPAVAYRLYTVVPRLIKFVDLLTNWYVRSNRKRLRGSGGIEDCRKALETLFTVLFSMVRMMAPFTPFLAELLYQNLKDINKSDSMEPRADQSVHYLMFPDPRFDLVDVNIERAVARMQTVVELGRQARERRTLPIKSPLAEVVIIHRDESFLEDIRSLEFYVQEELNVQTMMTTTDKEKYGVRVRAEPDHKTLGVRLKGTYKSICEAIKNLSDDALRKYQEEGFLDLNGTRLEGTDLKLIYTFASPASGDNAGEYEAASDNDVLVLLNVSQNQALLDEGTAREVCNRVQRLRKKAGLVPTDDIKVFFEVTPADSELSVVVQKFIDYVGNAIKKPFAAYPLPAGADVLVGEVQSLKEANLHLSIVAGPTYVDNRLKSLLLGE